MQLLGVAASVALAATAAQGVAATLVIDTFKDYQRVSDRAANGTYSSTRGGVGGLNASRTMTVTNVYYAGDKTEATSFVSSEGFLSFSNTSGAAGEATLSYSFEPANFLSYGPNPYFSFDVVSFDHNTWIEVSATDSQGQTVSYGESLETGFNPNLDLTSLTGSATFDWGSVTALKFIVSSTNPVTGEIVYDIDGRLASIALETVPLPASGLLLMGGVAGLAALRRRKNKSA